MPGWSRSLNLTDSLSLRHRSQTQGCLLRTRTGPALARQACVLPPSLIAAPRPLHPGCDLPPRLLRVLALSEPLASSLRLQLLCDTEESSAGSACKHFRPLTWEWVQCEWLLPSGLLATVSHASGLAKELQSIASVSQSQNETLHLYRQRQRRVRWLSGALAKQQEWPADDLKCALLWPRHRSSHHVRCRVLRCPSHFIL